MADFAAGGLATVLVVGEPSSARQGTEQGKLVRLLDQSPAADTGSRAWRRGPPLIPSFERSRRLDLSLSLGTERDRHPAGQRRRLCSAISRPRPPPGGRYFDVSLAWSPRPIWRAASRIVTSLFRVTSVVNTPFKSTSIVNTQIPVV